LKNLLKKGKIKKDNNKVKDPCDKEDFRMFSRGSQFSPLRPNNR
jgi:hypothetical protein